MAPRLCLVALACCTLGGYALLLICGSCSNGGPPPMSPNQLVLACAGATATISSIAFASYGNPTGSCGDFVPGPCNAANTTAVVEAACVGHHACSVWPNTTTFGDPCFGTPKELVVQFTCSDGGSGSADCVDGPPPPTESATATVDFSTALEAGVTLPSLQVVSQRLLLPWSGPIYETAWAGLANLTAKGLSSVRFVPWIPYPKMGVAELDPPSGSNLCGPRMWALGQSFDFELDCGADGGNIAAVDFASYGNAKGVCGAYTAGSCGDASTAEVVIAACVGKQSCVLGPSMFTHSTCPSTSAQYLAVQVHCSNPAKQHTYWNFTWVDQLFLDFWNATSGNTSEPIVNFSTPPTWLYDPTNFAYPDDPTVSWYGYEQGPSPVKNLTALGDYYGRLLSWYVLGGFTDEYGAYHSSGHSIDIRKYEVFNEVDYEHGHTPQSYTLEYDAIVSGIRRWLGPRADNITFIALSLPNIDDTSIVESFVSYFLNESNHDPIAWSAVANGEIGFHAYPTGSFGPFSPAPATFAGMFSYVDAFIAEVISVSALAQSLVPGIPIALDESGTDMDNVLNGALSPPADNALYWVAGGGYFAYLWSKAALLGSAVSVVAQSQFMDAPGQEPSVSMLDWSTGRGTAKYWVNDLLLSSYTQGDIFVVSNASDAASAPLLHAQGWVHLPSSAAASVAVLLIVKQDAFVNATVELGGVVYAGPACTLLCVDETTGLGPALPSPAVCSPASGTSVTVSAFLRPYATCVLTMPMA